MKKPALIRSPLKWAGGKYEVMPHLRKHLPKGKCLAEPRTTNPVSTEVF